MGKWIIGERITFIGVLRNWLRLLTHFSNLSTLVNLVSIVTVRGAILRATVMAIKHAVEKIA